MEFGDRLVKPSTRAFVREARSTPGYSLYDLIHGYVYARWPYLYIGIGTGEHPLSKWYARLAGWFQRLAGPRRNGNLGHEDIGFADSYHGKAVPLHTAEQLVHIHDDLEVHDLEQVIPYRRARSIIMRNPDRIVALECPCRAARPDPCLPLDVCLIVGDPFASFVREHHPRRSRWISRDEAVAILRAEDERGHVHHAFFKDAMLDRFYAICNCCECCCGAMQIQRSGTPMLTSSGYVSVLDSDLCIGCGDCNPFCQFGALEVTEAVNQIVYEKCMGCGVCVSKCAQDALSLVRDPAKGVPLEVCNLMAEALPFPQATSVVPSDRETAASRS
jgi:Pyruvate/2-oxoacid:ferredoxin oxidoreductase delta subunit